MRKNNKIIRLLLPGSVLNWREQKRAEKKRERGWRLYKEILAWKGKGNKNPVSERILRLPFLFFFPFLFSLELNRRFILFIRVKQWLFFFSSNSGRQGWNCSRSRLRHVYSGVSRQWVYFWQRRSFF